MKSNEYIGNYDLCATERRLVTNFLSRPEDRMISGRKSLRYDQPEQFVVYQAAENQS